MSTVLIVDDDEMLLKPLSVYLNKKGFTVLSTADGPQGITIYRQERPDVVVLDLNLPSLDGIEVLNEIKNYDPNAKIIILTGYRSLKTEKEALKIGAFAFVNKPFEMSMLIDIIDSAITEGDARGLLY